MIDTLKADAERLGIAWRGKPTIYMEGDGEHDLPYPPDWRETANAQAHRLGWRHVYTTTDDEGVL